MEFETLICSQVCCACECLLRESEHLNFIQTNMTAAWAYPVAGHVDTNDHLAIAVVCDDCIDQKRSPTKVIETRDEQVFYHALVEPTFN